VTSRQRRGRTAAGQEAAVRLSPQDEDFRQHVRHWLAGNLTGPFAGLRGAGGPGREHEKFAERLSWNQHLATAGWTCLGWPADCGGRGASLTRQVIFHEEYARAHGPALVGIVGEELLGPTLIALGTPRQRRRFLPPIAAARQLWCQGYSEPGAGSDLAAVATRATLDGDSWVITGQKTWTSLAHVADWCFVLARTEPGARRSAGLSCLLVPMRQPGVAMLGQQVGFRRELTELARRAGRSADPVIRDKLTRLWIGLEVMRAYALDTLARPAGCGPGATGSSAGGSPGAESSVLKLLWSRWHQRLGELAMEVQGAASLAARGAPYELNPWQRLFLFSRAQTIYGGSDEIQRNIIAERVLGLPREARP
jgi:alkylation response protein AidB-like acyl-CoA dehydrogenase